MSGTLLLPKSPDAISDSTCATTGRRRRKESVLALLKITTALDVQLHFWDPAMKSGLFFFHWRYFPTPGSSSVERTRRGGGEASPNQAGRKSHISHLTPGVPRKLDSLRVLQEGAGWMRMQMRGLPVCFSLLRSPRPPGQDSNRRSVSLWAGCLSATCNLGRKDCSNNALELCTNYAKWPNQLLFPSSAWCACLWMHCPIPPHPPTFFAFSFVGSSRRRDEQLRLFFPPPFVRKKKNGLVTFWTFHFFCVWFCPLLTLYSGTTCVFGFRHFWTITGAFLTLADLYFCC